MEMYMLAAAHAHHAVDTEVDADTIPQFCKRHRFSIPFYYKLKAQGLGPRELRLGARVLITRESAQVWRREREAASAATQVSITA
jgi:hypothetical protein